MRAWPDVTVIVVHHGPEALLRRCLSALRRLEYPKERLRVVVARDGVNNYCASNNRAVRAARTPYVALLNNDCRVDPDWLGRLVAAMELDPRLGGVMGKIRFPDGRIHSAGHEDLGHGHIRDLGFGESDSVRFDLPGGRDSLSHAACLYRRDAYLSVGGMDERFVMYYDDVDLGFRLRKAGWRLCYVPAAGAVHDRAPDRAWRDLFLHRNRLLFAAKAHPGNLAQWLFHSRLAVEPAWHPALYQVVPEIATRAQLPALMRVLARRGVPRAFRERIRRRAACALGLERPGLLVYDHALHFVGGGQKMAALLARALEDRLDASWIAHIPPPGDIWELHGLGRRPLVRVIPMDRRLGRTQIDPGMARVLKRDAFGKVSRASASAPFFLNANMVPGVSPRSDRSVFLCHFPDQPADPPFHVPEYDLLLCNSRYTRGWIRRRWKLEPHRLIYPPVDMAGPRRRKERILLSVARFDASGSKKQHEMIRAFARLRAPGWRLVLAGGSVTGERALLALQAELLRFPGLPVEIRADLPARRIRDLYARASVFWHLCGMGERNPGRVEHFGMAVAEAMQNGCVPVVFDGGGMRESVRQGVDGFRVRDVRGLLAGTRRLIRDPGLRSRMARACREDRFGPERFRREVREAILPMVDAYERPQPPEVDEVRSGRFMDGCRRVWDRSIA